MRYGHVTGAQTCALPISSWRRNEAPALSSPPKPTEETISPGTNHLKPTGTSNSSRPSEPTTQIGRASCRQSAQRQEAVAVHAREQGFHSPTLHTKDGECK